MGGFRDFLPFLPLIQRAPAAAAWLTYDQEGDVLYINFRKPSVATNSELTDDDVIIRYQGDEVIGFTVLHASQRSVSDLLRTDV